jgi:hypothetical protein
MILDIEWSRIKGSEPSHFSRTGVPFDQVRGVRSHDYTFRAESDQVSVSIEVRRVHDPLMDYVTCIHVDTFVYDSMPWIVHALHHRFRKSRKVHCLACIPFSALPHLAAILRASPMIS